MEELLKLLQEIRPDVDFDHTERLIDDQVLDSFDIVTLVGEMNDRFNIQIGVEHLLPENFNSVAAMLKLVEKLQS
jgi:D-alanine--poly(phosphoribitol) ligase subunit 2